MTATISKISSLSAHFIEKFEEIEFVAAYEWNKHVSVYANNIENELNYNALRLFCIKTIGPGGGTFKENEDIIVDYGDKGVLAFYQFNAGCWLIISTTSKSFPLINLEINKFTRGSIEFDLKID